MSNIFKFKYSLLLLAPVFFSCSKTLDVNNNPNTVREVSPDVLFNYALTSWSAKKQDGDGYIPFAFLTQTQASGGNYGWGKSDVYDINPVVIRNMWRCYYVNAGNNLKLAIEQAENASPKNNNAAAQSKILLANLAYECSTIWGDIPFSEAWNKSIPYPKFDSQKEVFDEVLGLLDEAIAQVDESSSVKIGEYDILYHGDMARWKKYATALKLKVLMTMVDKDPTKASAIGALIQSGNMLSSSSDNVLYPFLNVPGKENPKNRILTTYTGGFNFFFYCNNNVFKFMKEYDDPRISVYFTKGADDNYIPVETEEDANDKSAVLNAETLFRAEAPHVILSLQEQLLFEAEAYARGLGVSVNLTKADELYKKGVRASLEFNGVGESEITAYLNTIPSLTTATDPVKEIHKQQWIDLQDRPLEAFTQWRRSGTEGNEFPQLSLPPGTSTTSLMRRWDYPQAAEIIPNKNAPATLPLITDKLWFDL